MARIIYFGVFDRPFDTEVYISNTLESLGHSVQRTNTGRVSSNELKWLLNNGYDFALFSKGWFKNEKEAIEIIKESKIKTVGWFWDLCWGTSRENLLSDHHLFKDSEVFTSDGGDRNWLKYGIKHQTLRQGIYEPEAIKGKFNDKFDYDVIFVGSNSHQSNFGWKHRTDLLKFLKEQYGSRFRHIGNDEEIRNLELNDVYASAKIVVGDSVYAPHYWSNRLYETIGRGGFLIFPMIDGLEKEFTPYKHFIPYKYYDFTGLKEKIDFYLDHPEERNKIRDAGFEYCKQNHTYTERCKKLLKLI